MLTTEDLLALVKTGESQYLERKSSCPENAELRATITAFANSTPDNQFSVLLIGIADDGKICGVDPSTVDGTQKKIIKIARDDCYPPIYVVPQLIEVDGKTILAVVVKHSKTTPHFTGHAYVRTGPTNQKASKEQFEELVLMRIEKVARLLKEKRTGSVVRVDDTGGQAARCESPKLGRLFKNSASRFLPYAGKL